MLEQLGPMGQERVNRVLLAPIRQPLVLLCAQCVQQGKVPQ